MRAPWKIGLLVPIEPQPLEAVENDLGVLVVERALSVSSMRSRKCRRSFRAYSQLKSAVRAPPTWR